MKKVWNFCMVLLVLLSLAGCKGKDYTEQINGLNGQKFFLDGESDVGVNVLSFEEGKAVLVKKSCDGNGIHEDETTEYTIAADDENMTLSAEGKEDLVFAYTFEEGNTVLNDPRLYDEKFVEDAIQGIWLYDDVVKGKVESHYIHSLKVDNGRGEYGYGTATYQGRASLVNYFGHEKGSYTMGDGEVTFDFRHGDEFFFSIYGGKVKLMYYANEMKPDSTFLDEKAFKRKY